MAPRVSLSDEAFDILRRERREDESDSDVVIRLYRAAQHRQRDPVAFFRHPPRTDLSTEGYDRVREKMAAADRDRAR